MCLSMFSTPGASAGLASVFGGEPVTDGLNGLQQGGPAGLADLYRRYSAWLTARVAHRFGVDQAEDLAQETWLRIAPYQARGEIRHPKALLLRIASNLAIDAGRRGGGREAVPDDDAADAPADPPPQTELLLLKQVVLSLPQPWRDVFVLNRFACLTYDQIGERLGISTKTVEWRMKKALAHCAVRLRL